MAWRVEFTSRAERELGRLDAPIRVRILKFLAERVAAAGNPRTLGKALTGSHAGTWRYRVGDYRILCRIEDDRLVVLVVDIGHRSSVYGG